MMTYQKPVKNFTPGRAKVPSMVVIHIGEGSQQVIYNTFLTEPKSSHYCVAKNGDVWQFVQEKDCAWANGKIFKPSHPYVIANPGINPNEYTISIEHEGFATADITEAQYASTAMLVKEICKRWNIPLDRQHVISHKEIRSDKTCPGMINVDRIVSLASPVPGSPSKVEQAKKLLQEALKLLE